MRRTRPDCAGHNHITLQVHHLSHIVTRLSQWEAMLDAPDHPEPFLDEAQASPKPVSRWRRALSVSSPLSPTRRALLLTALGGLMIAGVITVLPDSAAGGRLAGVAVEQEVLDRVPSPGPARLANIDVDGHARGLGPGLGEVLVCGSPDLRGTLGERVCGRVGLR